MEKLLAQTSLPNLHPAFVHFPIVLFLVAWMMDWLAWMLPSREWIRKTAILLIVLGALAAGATYWTGEEAAETVDISAEAQPILARHENFAEYTLWFFGIYAGFRIVLQAFLSCKRALHFFLILLAGFGLFFLLQTADLGGSLVFRYAVGVKVPEPPPASPPPVIPPGELSKPVMEGSNLTWIFGPGAEKTVMEFLPKEKKGKLQAKTETYHDQQVLTLIKSDSEPVMISFNPSYSDVQMEAVLDLTHFNGTVSLVHHLSDNQYDAFSISKQRAAVERISNNKKIFGEKNLQFPAGLIKVKAVAADTHFRGYINNKLEVHGHGEPAPEGKAALKLEGTGTLRLAEIRIHSLASYLETEEHHH